MIAALVFLMGVTIRHFFNSMHARKGMPWWTWGVTVALFLAVVWLSTLGTGEVAEAEDEEAAMSATAERFAAAEGFEDVYDIVLGRCSMCHAVETGYDGVPHAPKGVVLETEAQVAEYARDIYLQAGRSVAMPPANVSWMEPEERQTIVRWYQGASETKLAMGH